MHGSPDERWLMFLGKAKGIRAYIRRRVDHPTEADEIFQEVSLMVLRHRSGPDDEERFSAWCYALARHALAHHFRSKRRRASLLDRVELDPVGFEAERGPDPERSASARQTLARLVKSLDPHARELLSQRYLLGETAAEIALRAEQSAAAVRMRLMRLRSVAKRKFAPEIE